jgi:hypothetical protein
MGYYGKADFGAEMCQRLTETTLACLARNSIHQTQHYRKKDGNTSIIFAEGYSAKGGLQCTPTLQPARLAAYHETD